MIIEVNSKIIELPYDIEELIDPENDFEYKQYTISWLNWYGLSEDERMELLTAYGMLFPESEDAYELCLAENTSTKEVAVYLYECTFTDPYDYWKEAIDKGIERTMGKGGKFYDRSLKAVNI